LAVGFGVARRLEDGQLGGLAEADEGELDGAVELLQVRAGLGVEDVLVERREPAGVVGQEGYEVDSGQQHLGLPRSSPARERVWCVRFPGLVQGSPPPREAFESWL
jgi:hypothetical protein